MTRLLIAAISGWGKGYVAQAIIEENLKDVDYAVIMDYKDEYRGLVKGDLAKHVIVGPSESVSLSVADWRTLLRANPKLVIARHGLNHEDWRTVAARAVEAVRSMQGDALAVIDEAHFVVPQQGGYPDALKGLATTGRGEGVMSIWVTQRMAEADETVIAQADEQIIGGFQSEQDRKKPELEYPREVHKPGGLSLDGLPPDLEADREPISLRRFEDDDGHTVGSEWVFSDGMGNLERWDTSNWNPETTHHGKEGGSLKYPGGNA